MYPLESCSPSPVELPSMLRVCTAELKLSIRPVDSRSRFFSRCSCHSYRYSTTSKPLPHDLVSSAMPAIPRTCPTRGNSWPRRGSGTSRTPDFARAVQRFCALYLVWIVLLLPEFVHCDLYPAFSSSCENENTPDEIGSYCGDFLVLSFQQSFELRLENLQPFSSSVSWYPLSTLLYGAAFSTF